MTLPFHQDETIEGHDANKPIIAKVANDSGGNP